VRYRSVGGAARSTDALSADEFLFELRTLVEEKPPNWRLHAASTVLVLGEVIFGASPAWSEITGWRHLASEAWAMTDAGMHCAALASSAAFAVDEIAAPATLAANEGTRQHARKNSELLTGFPFLPPAADVLTRSKTCVRLRAAAMSV